MRAFMSNPDSGVRNLRPDLYEADRLWLERTAVDEASMVVAATALKVYAPGQSVHVYNGPRELRRSATENSVNGLAPAGFVVSARDAIVETLTRFLVD